MKPKKSVRLSKESVQRQKQIEKRVEDEKIRLGHPQGEERFRRVIEQASKKLGRKK